jgi:hypothetical protein
LLDVIARLRERSEMTILLTTHHSTRPSGCPTGSHHASRRIVAWSSGELIAAPAISSWSSTGDPGASLASLPAPGSPAATRSPSARP